MGRRGLSKSTDPGTHSWQLSIHRPEGPGACVLTGPCSRVSKPCPPPTYTQWEEHARSDKLAYLLPSGPAAPTADPWLRLGAENTGLQPAATELAAQGS